MHEISTNTPQRKYYLDLLKIVASFAVVSIHTTARSFSLFAIDSKSWLACDLIDTLCHWCVPAFLLITGALLLNPKKDVSVRSIWTKKIPRYAAFYLIWSLIYAIRTVCQNGWQGGWEFIGSVVAGEYHLWYLPMLIGVLALLPILRAIATNRKLLVYACVLFFGLSFFGYVGSSEWLVGLRFPELLNDLHLVASYAGYCLLGYLLATEPISNLKRWLPLVIILGVAGLAVTFLGTAFLTLSAGTEVFLFYEYLLPNTVTPAVAIFCLFRVICEGRGWHFGSGRLLVGLSGCSLGVYLLHPMILFLTYDFAAVLIERSVLFLPLWSIAIWLLSVVLVFCWRRIFRALRGK